MTEKRALLIGINSYPNFEPGQQLAGCVNDVEVMAALLGGAYGFSDVVTLVEGDATREGILAALNGLTGRVGNDDVVVVHYSGHGSQITDEEGDEPDGMDETIVPHDSGRTPHPNRDITDDELYAWIRDLTGKTRNLTLVFDCCHSGTITRDVFGSRARWVEPDERPPSELRQPRVPEHAGRRPRDTGPSDWLPIGKYVLIAGCQDDESSYELAAGDGGSVIEHGALTYFLAQELAQAIPGMTYRDVFERVRTRVSAAHPRQHPQLEGTSHRELFGLRDFEPMRFVSITSREATTVKLGAGAAHGVVVGSEWDVYPAGTKQVGGAVQPIGHVRAMAVRSVEADAEIESEAGPGAIAPDARAVEASRPLTVHRLRVAVEVPADYESQAKVLRTRLERSPLTAPAEADMPPDLQAYVIAPRAASGVPVPQLGAVDEASWVVIGRDGRLAMPAHPVAEQGVLELLVENFEKLARYRNGLALANDAPDSAVRGRVELHLRVRASDGGWQDVQVGAEGRVVLHEGDQFCVEVANHHNVSVYVAILDFGVTGKIDLLYPFNGASEPIEPGRSLVLGEREPFRLNFPEVFPFVRDPGEPEVVEGHETFKVFAVTGRPVTFDWLRQEAVRGAVIAERAAFEEVAREALGDPRRDIATVRPTPAELEDWTTVEFSFVLRRVDSAGGKPQNPTSQRARPAAAPAGAAINTSQTPLYQGHNEKIRPRGGAAVFDKKFARDAAFTLTFVGVLLLWPLWIVSARVVFGDSPAGSLSELIAIQLVIAGVAVAFAGFYLTLLEFRSRALVAEIANETEEGASRGLVTEAIKATPEILKAFGQLKPVASLLVIAALLFVCATALAWHGFG